MTTCKSLFAAIPLLAISLTGCSGSSAAEDNGVSAHVEDDVKSGELALKAGETKSISVRCAPKTERGCRYVFTTTLANDEELRNRLLEIPNAGSPDDGNDHAYRIVMNGTFSGFSTQDVSWGYSTNGGTSTWDTDSTTTLSAGEHQITFALPSNVPSSFPAVRFTIASTSEEESEAHVDNHVLVLDADGQPHANDDAVVRWVSPFVRAPQACAQDSECMSTSAVCLNRVCAEPELKLTTDAKGALDFSTVSGIWEVVVGGTTFGFEARGFDEVETLQL